MSKSYKKTPVIHDNYGSKQLQWYKRQANKKVRKAVDIPCGKAYRKVYETWNIHDYRFWETFQTHFKNKESDLKHYLKVYGSIENIPQRLAKQFYDVHNYLWKKYYYRK